MTTPDTSLSVPSEFDDEVDNDDANLPPGHVWAYPCKHHSCPDYGKSWLLRSNFLLHLQEREAHSMTTTTASARRVIEKEWRYTTDPHLPPRTAPNFRPQEDPDEHQWDYGFKDHTGKVIQGRSTMKEIELHMAKHRQQTREFSSSST